MSDLPYVYSISEFDIINGALDEEIAQLMKTQKAYE